MFTDGMAEAPADGEPLGYDWFEQIVGEMKPRGEADLAQLVARVELAAAESRSDDWTAVLLTRRQ